MSDDAGAIEREIVALARRVCGAANGRTPAVVQALGGVGLLGLAVSEESGGSGSTSSAAGNLNAVAGSLLAHPNLIHTQVAGYAMASSGAPASRVSETLSGTRTTVVMFRLSDDAAPLGGVIVPFGVQEADVVLIRSNTVERWTAELELVDQGWLNPIGPDARVHLKGRLDTFASIPHRILAFGRAISSAYMLGSARALVERTSSFATERTQFGRPIGAFQAVKHHLADASIRLAHADALCAAAFVALDESDVEAPRICAWAKHAAGEAAQFSAERCMQVTGGIAFTWESDVHLYLKTIMRLRQWPTHAAALHDELSGGVWPMASTGWRSA
jgi:alkylation response protein AidB-like acyl-CoA dehydrogenase